MSNCPPRICRISKLRLNSTLRLPNFSPIEGAAMDEQERHSKGMEVRRAVLGNAHVDRTQTKRNNFNGEFQDLLTRYAWGEIWTRPGLPRHTRSLLTIALMIALNRSEEFKLHVRAAFNNGVTRDEIKEVILQCAIYAGVPAANSAFHMAEEVFAQLDAAGEGIEKRANLYIATSLSPPRAYLLLTAAHLMGTPLSSRDQGAARVA